MATRNPKKIAATMLALGAASSAVVFGSYAAWTATSSNPGNKVTTGTMSFTNDRDGVKVFDVASAKPGGSGGSTVTLANSGSTPMSAVKLTQGAVTNTVGAALQLQIHDDTTNRCLWPTQAAGSCPAYGAWDATAMLTDFSVQGTGGGSTWASLETHTFTVNWSFDAAAGNATQNKAGAFALTWDGVQ